MNCDTYLATVTLQKERPKVVLTSPDRAPVFSQGESGRQGEWVVEEGTQVLDDLPLVFLHVLEPDELHIVSVSAFPTSYNVLPVVPIKL